MGQEITRGLLELWFYNQEKLENHAECVILTAETIIKLLSYDTHGVWL